MPIDVMRNYDRLFIHGRLKPESAELLQLIESMPYDRCWSAREFVQYVQDSRTGENPALWNFVCVLEHAWMTGMIWSVSSDDCPAMNRLWSRNPDLKIED